MFELGIRRLLLMNPTQDTVLLINLINSISLSLMLGIFNVTALILQMDIAILITVISFILFINIVVSAMLLVYGRERTAAAAAAAAAAASIVELPIAEIVTQRPLTPLTTDQIL